MLPNDLKLAKIALLEIHGADQTRKGLEVAPHAPEIHLDTRPCALGPSEVVTRRNLMILRSHERPARDVAQKATTAEPVMLVMM